MSKGELADGADIALGQWRAVFRLHGSAQSEVATEVGNRTELQPRESASRWQPAQVRIKQGNDESVHKLTADSFTVGKDPACDLVIQDSFISSRHLKVTRRDGHFHVLDTNSTNGTFMGTVRVFEVEVRPAHHAARGRDGPHPRARHPGRARSCPSTASSAATRPCGSSSELIERVAPSSAAVAILGESGTGKELVARALHECSQRADKPFIPVNCAAISKELIESELFGHEKGSFTGAANARKGAFEEADGGTLFLDEIGELPLDLQAKLLRALESGEIKRVGASRPIHVDVRVVAATNRDLIMAGARGPLPRGPVLPPVRRPPAPAAPAQPPRRHPRPGRALPAHVLAPGPDGALHPRRHGAAPAARAGRATSASCATWCTAPCCCARAPPSTPPTSPSTRR